MPVRTIMAVDLFEVSAVAFPAYADTSIALRSLATLRKDTNRIGYAVRKARMEHSLRKI
jgi:phage head maturation protease